MATNDERREVAERLRELSGKRDTQGFDCLLAEAVRGYEFCEAPCDECHRRLAAELADLIEPTPNRSEDTPKCDRDALLAVAETLEDCAGRGSDLTALGYSCLAKRIREALGVAEDE